MIANPDFEIVEIAGEFMAVPVGKASRSFNGVVSLTEPAAFLLDKMRNHKEQSELIDILMNEYDITRDRAQADIDKIISIFSEIGLVYEE